VEQDRNQGGRACYREEALPLSHEFDAAGAAPLNVQLLRVTGLMSGQYNFTIDGFPMGTFWSEQFAEGLNLTTLATPVMKQASQVHALTLRTWDYNTLAGSNRKGPPPTPTR
jgi:hypothetical protein